MKSAISIFLDKAAKKATIDIDGYIGFNRSKEKKDQNTKERLKKELRDIANIKADTIVVNINSYGGDVNHGISIHDLLAEHSAKVITKINGMTASAATIIAAAGDERTMSDNSLALVHRASTWGWGNANNLEEIVQDLKTIDDRIANIYAKTGSEDKKFFHDLMNENNGNGKWIDATEMKKIGLITEIFEPKAMAAVVGFDFAAHNLPEPPENLIQKCEARSPQSQNLADEIWEKIQKFLKPSNSKSQDMTPEDISKKFEDMQKLINDQAAQIAALQNPNSDPAPANEPDTDPAPTNDTEPDITALMDEIKALKDQIKTMQDQASAPPTGGVTGDADPTPEVEPWKQTGMYAKAKKIAESHAEEDVEE